MDGSGFLGTPDRSSGSGAVGRGVQADDFFRDGGEQSAQPISRVRGDERTWIDRDERERENSGPNSRQTQLESAFVWWWEGENELGAKL